MLGSYKIKIPYKYKQDSSFNLYNISLIKNQQIKKNSNGEISKPFIFKKVNGTFKQEQGSLFCNYVFGDIEEYKCDCGLMGTSVELMNINQIIGIDNKTSRFTKHSSSICSKCGASITPISNRIQRWGHIELAAPIIHPWFIYYKPNIIANLLSLKIQDVLDVIYCKKYLVIYSNVNSILQHQVIDEHTYTNYEKNLKVEKGANAFLNVLKKIDIYNCYRELKLSINEKMAKYRRDKINKKLKILHYFLEAGDHPCDMFMYYVPVLPPDLRMIMFNYPEEYIKSHKINYKYIDVIHRNNKLKRLIQLGAPNIIIQNEKKLLQESVDSLFLNKYINELETSNEEKSNVDVSLSNIVTNYCEDNPQTFINITNHTYVQIRDHKKTPYNVIIDALNNLNELNFILFYSYDTYFYYKTIMYMLYALMIDVKQNNKNLKDLLSLDSFQILSKKQYDFFLLYHKNFSDSINEIDIKHFSKGNIYFYQCDYPHAILEYTKCIKCNSKHSDAYLSRAISFYKNFDIFPLMQYKVSNKNNNVVNYALNDLTHAIKLNPSCAEAYYYRGCIYDYLSKYDYALTDLTQAINLNNQHVNALKKRALIYNIHYNNKSLASNDYIKIKQIDGDDINFYRDNAFMFMQEDYFETALYYFEQILKIKPDNIEALHNISTCYKALGYLSTSISYINSLLQKSNSDDYKAELLLERAYIYDNYQQYDLAISDLNNYISMQYSLDDEISSLQYYILVRANIYYKNNQLINALNDYLTVIQYYNVLLCFYDLYDQADIDTCLDAIYNCACLYKKFNNLQLTYKKFNHFLYYVNYFNQINDFKDQIKTANHFIYLYINGTRLP